MSTTLVTLGKVIQPEWPKLLLFFPSGSRSEAVGKLNIILWMYFRMYLDKNQLIFEKKSLPLKFRWMRTNYLHSFYDQKRSIYLMLQFINWLSFLHNMQLNFLVTVFCLVLLMVISKMIHNLQKSWMQTALQGTSVSKGTQWLSSCSEPFNHKYIPTIVTLRDTSQIISFSSCNWLAMLQNKPHRKNG